MTLAISRGHNPDDSKRKRRWRTPLPLFHSLQGQGFRFVLDAAAEPGAQLVPRYIAPPDYDLSGVADDQQPIAIDCLVSPWSRRRVTDGWAFINSPWGPAFSRCPADCIKDKKKSSHVHHTADFPGTAAFVDAAIRNASLINVMALWPNAPDTSWWRDAFRASFEVRMLPRVSFIDPDTGESMDAPPGSGVTLFLMGGDSVRGPRPDNQPRVLLCDRLGVPE